ncbi:hypothetical protein CK203_033256 [Vitis vinifera]|uniref:Carbohydrate kinase PfkB domain-containing protein n=1 Tax=Vitis vinifera TaxID=29760 RepID=A0A438HBW8_VITVI|nr:hypothetical protein CK203_033256 [Vitis vinifera]
MHNKQCFASSLCKIFVNFIADYLQAARDAGVPVILDAGGMDAPIPVELLNVVDILSPNESELARLTRMPTESFEQISQAVAKCHEMGKNQLDNQSYLLQKFSITTGAGDTFTAAFAVAFVEGRSKKECLRFAAAAASLCVQVKGPFQACLTDGQFWIFYRLVDNEYVCL